MDEEAQKKKEAIKAINIVRQYILSLGQRKFDIYREIHEAHFWLGILEDNLQKGEKLNDQADIDF
jgi:hypothetical protein